MSAKITLTGGSAHPGGVVIGSTPTEKIGFHGKTPTVQQAVEKSAGSTPTQAEFDKLVDALIALGLVKLEE